ncbi:non-homologous end joining protein Ku [Bradyrhizobium sp. USDA 4011]
MLDLTKHIVDHKAAYFEPDEFDDHYESALIDRMNKKEVDQPIAKKERPSVSDVVDVMDDCARKSTRSGRGCRLRSHSDFAADREQETDECCRQEHGGETAAEVCYVVRSA